MPKQALPKYLSKFKDDKYADVGSLKEPDFEKVADLDPDLIIISGRQSESYKEFSEIAPTIYLGVDTAKYMESFKSDAETIGKIFDKEDEVKDELATIDHSIADLKKKLKSLTKTVLLLWRTTEKSARSVLNQDTA